MRRLRQEGSRGVREEVPGWRAQTVQSTMHTSKIKLSHDEGIELSAAKKAGCIDQKGYPIVGQAVDLCQLAVQQANRGQSAALHSYLNVICEVIRAILMLYAQAALPLRRRLWPKTPQQTRARALKWPHAQPQLPTQSLIPALPEPWPLPLNGLLRPVQQDLFARRPR